VVQNRPFDELAGVKPDNDQSVSGMFVMDHGRCGMSETRRHVEQLVLYVRALQLLASAIQLAQAQMRNGRLQSSMSVKASK